MRVGIDGSNLRDGGGQTHLVQLLTAADPAAAGVERVMVWGARRLLEQLPERPWLERVHDPALEGSGPQRAWWQSVELTRLARASADVLFVPGATYLGRFRPFVTMFRNMLPFDETEVRQYGLSAWRLKLAILARTQASTFRRADGVIFLTDHARRHLSGRVRIGGRVAVIPHGLHPRFFQPERPQRPIAEYSAASPFTWVYVSAIHRYKHHPEIAEAVARLRAEGLPVRVDFIGALVADGMARLEPAMKRVDPGGAFVRMRAALPHKELAAAYANADAFVFGSSCENLPNSLLEAMAAGLPIACSNRPPMPEILGDGGIYFDPREPGSIAAAMRRVTMDIGVRESLVRCARERARAYDWSRCAGDTFAFLAGVHREPPTVEAPDVTTMAAPLR